jgi:ATP-dependent exoDNAse (exonuclease V) alpha subunit
MSSRFTLQIATLGTSAPTSADGIEKYLSSGMIRGVGPVYAKKLVRVFGEKVCDIIEPSPDRLRDDGIGPVRAASTFAAWAEQKSVREIMVFLHSHGVSTGRAVRIFKIYGADAIQIITDKPVPLGSGHSWHRLQDRRRDRHEARYREGFGQGFPMRSPRRSTKAIAGCRQTSWCPWPRSCSRYRCN